MVEGDRNISNSYEEARKQRLEENKKRFQELGISSISEDLADLASSQKKPQQQRVLKSKANKIYELEPRRSSRARNPVPSYYDNEDMDLPSMHKRRSKSSSWTSYLARPLDEIKMASYKQRVCAHRAAQEIQSNLPSRNPSFIKLMVRSHVYSCFWLGLPSKFCEEHLPKTVLDVVLEDENGSEYNATYLGNRTGLSGGWRAFALDHKLDDGDAVLFELIEPTRFKVYIVKASSDDSPERDEDSLDNKAGMKKKTKRVKMDDKMQKLKEHAACESDGKSSPEKEDKMAAEENGSAPRRSLRNRGTKANANSGGGR